MPESNLKHMPPLAAGASAGRRASGDAVRVDSTPNNPHSQSPLLPASSRCLFTSAQEPISIYVAALALFDFGCGLIPLKPGSKWIRPGYGPSQKRLTTYGDCYRQFVTLRSNIGILTGGESGLCVLDCDDEETYQRIIKRWPVLSETFTVQTATPGHRHIYVLAGDLPSGTVDGVEVKARGRVVVGPASVVGCVRYTPIDWNAPIIAIDPADFSFFSALTRKADVPLKKEKPRSGDDLIARLKKAWSLIEVCESHGVKLTGAGRLRRAKCPLHSETRASFTVDMVRGLWRCFGCDAHGDVINLMAMLENITVAEAIQVMARRLPVGGCGA